jgi:hypothetical protein
VVIFARRKTDWWTLLVSLALVMFGLGSHPVAPTMRALADADRRWTVPVEMVTFLAWALVLVAVYLFPTGRLVHRGLLPVVLASVLLYVPWVFFPDSAFSPTAWPPFLHGLAVVTIWGTPALAQVYRYARTSDPLQKQQAKWLIVGVSGSLLGAIGFYLPGILQVQFTETTGQVYALLSPPIIRFFALLAPLAIGLSILRYRLWDIDIIINRTLVYIPLTGILAGLYAGVNTLLQRLFVAFTGTHSDAVVAIATLSLAAAFTPIKNWLQSIVDRYFKEAPDPTKRLKLLGAQMESFIEMSNAEAIARRVVDEAASAFEASNGAVYFREGSGERLVYAYGDAEPGIAQISVPLERDGERFGSLELGPRERGALYTRHDLETLAEIAHLLTSMIRPASGSKRFTSEEKAQ